ncbi:MAG: SRPBCC domain-containing protein [Actinomycetota bacterium]|nr:SRPBCC domain-containing protein [Actinomycetota bacterium]
MELEHSFTVPVPMDRAWDVLLDVERVAPCMPGATLDSVDGDEIRGRIKVKVGPINMTYAGTARFIEKDAEAGVVTLEASGKETKGAGTASASVRSVLTGRGNETQVSVQTTLNVTGKPAQFGRGVMNEVGGRLIGIFAANLATVLAEQQSAPAAGPGEAGPGPGTEGDQRARPIEDLNLPPRALHALQRESIGTLGDLAARTAADLLAIDGIGPASLEDIRSGLAERGLVLGEPAAPQPPSQPAGPTAPVAPAGPAGSADVRAAAHRVEDDAARLFTAAGQGPDAARAAAHQLEDDAINLLQVAGLPVLKRAIPVVVGLLAVGAIALGVRRRRRARN